MVEYLSSLRGMAVGAPVLQLPLWQVLLFVVLISVAAMFERHRLVLVLSYVFSVYWVFIENLKLHSLNRISMTAFVVFAVFGILGLSLTLYQMLTSRY